MKKILFILTIVALAPLATQAENLLNTDEAFQVARAFKLGRESSNGGAGGPTMYGQKKGKMKQVHIVCPDYKYYRQKDVNGNAVTPMCVDVCTDVECKTGTTRKKKINSCYCEEN